MSVLSALADGCQRVLRAPVLVAGLWLIYSVVPVPVATDRLDAFMAMIDASAIDPMPALLTMIGGRETWVHAALVTFLLGGFMDRLARDRAVATFGFFGAAGTFCFRFLRLDLIAWPLYALTLLWLYPRLPAGQAASDIVLAVLVFALSAIFDFARVRMIVEDRRSAFGAVVSAVRFTRRNAGSVIAVIAINAALAAATWWLAAIFGIGATTAIYAYLLARALLRLVFMASAIALFQRRLAHAGYVARRVATWPESPAAEAVLPQ